MPIIAEGQPLSSRILESQREHEDRTKSDLIVSKGPGVIRKGRLIGRPGFLLELKQYSDFSLKTHLDQVLHYTRELLGRHCGMQKLPFAILTPKFYYVGIADWKNFSNRHFRVSSYRYDLYE